MARINSEITISRELRPCILNGKEKALFHCWENWAQPTAAGLTKGSHPGGQCSMVYGLVELEGGHMMRVNPVNIRFIDDKHEEICWRELEAQG